MRRLPASTCPLTMGLLWIVLPHLLIIHILPLLDGETMDSTRGLLILYALLSFSAVQAVHRTCPVCRLREVLMVVIPSALLLAFIPIPETARAVYGAHFADLLPLVTLSGILLLAYPRRAPADA
ncbi:MAG: hypothetical protein PHI49_10315 [Halothiobacillaceae bacterium]|nr:hypothetical protein [Halothiobacillaceae bacterium]